MDIDKLIELYNNRLTLLQIGKELGVTRSTVSGKISRLKAKQPELFTRGVIPEKKEPKPARVKKEPPPKKIRLVKSAEAPVKHIPNRYTFSLRPRTHVNATKAQLYQELYMAVKNTK